MAEHLLHRAEVGASLEQVRRERMPEEVWVHPLWLEPGLVCELPQDEKGAGACQRAAAGVQEELRTVPPVEVRAAESEIATDSLGRRASERDDPLLPALPDHADDAVVQRDAVLLEARGLGDTQTGAVEQLDERTVAQRAWRGPGRRVDQPLRLGWRERAR